jgi:hypothetical protein
MTKEEVAEALAETRGVSHVPHPASLNALLCKSASIISVGKREVENIVGQKSKHLLYDVDREVVLTESDLTYVREPCTMTPKEKARASKCPGCSRTRIFPEGSEQCLTCERLS